MRRTGPSGSCDESLAYQSPTRRCGNCHIAAVHSAGLPRVTFRNLTLEHSEMNNGTLEDLFLRELQEAYAAERLILGSLAMPAHALKGVDTFLDRYVTSTRERVRHLEQIFALAGCTPDESSRSPMAGMIAEISGLAAIADPEVQETVRTSLQVVQHYLVAQYAMLASWARLLQEQSPSLQR